MKKLLFMLCASLMIVACGGKNDKKCESNEESKPALLVEYSHAMLKALEADDIDKFITLSKQSEEFARGLSEEEFAKQQQVVTGWSKSDDGRRFFELYTKNRQEIEARLGIKSRLVKNKQLVNKTVTNK